MESAVLIAAIGLLAVIAYSDMRSRRIPNVLSLAIAILGLTRVGLAHDTAATQTLAAVAITFAATFLLFRRGVMGGGDAKLIAATVLLVGWHEMLRFLLLMSVCGGVLALTILALDQFRLGHRGLSHRASKSLETGAAANRIAGLTNTTVPYGVAVAAAGAISLVFQSPFLR
jgi:prepilin peptidase CpaA